MILLDQNQESPLMHIFKICGNYDSLQVRHVTIDQYLLTTSNMETMSLGSTVYFAYHNQYSDWHIMGVL